MSSLRFTVVLAALVAWGGSVSADAVPGNEAAPGAGLDGGRLTIGFDGTYEVGRWTECRLEATDLPPKCRLVVRAPDPDGQVVSYPGRWAENASTLIANFVSGRLDGIDDVSLLEVLLETPDGIVERRPLNRSTVRPSRQDVSLIGIVGSPGGFEDFLGETTTIPREDWSIVPFAALAELPSSALGLQGLDVLLVAGNYEIDERRLDAIREWVWNGGHLVLATGASFRDYRTSRFATHAQEWIPFTVGEEPLRLRELERLVAFAERNASIPIFGSVDAARISAPEGTVLAESRNDPLVARVVAGFGHVTFLAVDLDKPPLSEWSAVGDFVAKLIEIRDESRGRAATDNDQRLTHSGISDLATQLNAAQETFDGVHGRSRWAVMGYILLFLVVIGPLDYLFVHRVLGRPEWTWATFPVVVLLATLLGLRSASATNGSALRANRVTIVDIDTATGTLRGRGFVTVYSPVNRRYAVRGEVHPLASATGDGVAPRLNWSGLPEDAYGGMYRTGGLSFERLRYDHGAEADRFENVPIPVWSTKPFQVEWEAPATSLIRSDLADDGQGRLTGTIEHSLPQPLENWMLAYGNRLYRPKSVDNERPPLPAGAKWSMSDDDTVARELRTYLTRTEVTTVDAARETDRRTIREQRAYDSLSRDLRPLVEMITLHRAAGGRSYTGLENASLDRLDLSNLILADRAVLIARLANPLLTVHTADGPIDEGRAETFIRIVLPVK